MQAMAMQAIAIEAMHLQGITKNRKKMKYVGQACRGVLTTLKVLGAPMGLLLTRGSAPLVGRARFFFKKIPRRMPTANAEGARRPEGALQGAPRRDLSDAAPGFGLARRRSPSACAENLGKNRDALWPPGCAGVVQ